MKKNLAVLFVFLLVFGAVSAQDSDTAETVHEITRREYTFYIFDTDTYWTEPVPLYFMDGVDDIPYLNLKEWLEIVVTLNRSLLDDTDYDLVFNWDGNDAAYIRESDYRMVFDFEADTITFDDYNGFMHDSHEKALLDILSASGYDEAGQSILYYRNPDTYMDRYGDVLKLNLKAYGIPMIAQEGEYYLPVQTISDIWTSPLFLRPLIFNGENLFLANADDFGKVRNGLTPLGELYYAAKPKERSKELADFGYRELCFALDNLYGLKETHDISNFDQLFWQIAFDKDLSSTDPEVSDAALYKFIDYHLDDLHSTFDNYSYQTGAREVPWGTGPASVRFNEAAETYYEAREAVFGDDWYKYEEVGNTAYITFDTFDIKGSGPDYYAFVDGEDIPLDTLGLIIYAHSMINREDSPVENVVIDLSNNTGGSVDAAIFVMSWFLGEAPFSVRDMQTGALTTANYRADINLDHVFDEKDTLAGKNLFCLISPVSFSCGNLVPAAFKASGKVTLMGRTSGGGSCTLQPISTAWGTQITISGTHRMSFLKNGSFYDIDQGIAPDYTISSPAKFYDREALMEFINKQIF